MHHHKKGLRRLWQHVKHSKRPLLIRVGVLVVAIIVLVAGLALLKEPVGLGKVIEFAVEFLADKGAEMME